MLRTITWWRDARLPGALRVAVPLVGVLGAVLITATAYYGGALVYGLGVNVAHAAGG